MNETEVRKILEEIYDLGSDEAFTYREEAIAEAFTKVKALFPSELKLSEDMTAAYMVGFEKGKDSVLARMEVGEIEKVIWSKGTQLGIILTDSTVSWLAFAIVKHLKGE